MSKKWDDTDDHTPKPLTEPSTEWKSPPLWVEGDRVTVFDATDSTADRLMGFVGVECVVVSPVDPEDDDSMVGVRHANGMRGDFWPEELAPVGTPPTKRAEYAIQAQVDRVPSLTEAFARVQAWQARTFGESSPMEARADKLVDEAREVVGAVYELQPGDDESRKRAMAELADVCFLVADLLRGLDAGTVDLVSAILGKLHINERDKWVADATGKYSRVKPTTTTDDTEA